MSLRNSAFKMVHGLAATHLGLPKLVIEIQPQYVLGARVDTRARLVRRMSVRELPERGVEFDGDLTRVSNEAELRDALGRVSDVVGNSTNRLALLLPDPSVRVFLLSFETVPADPREAEALLRWRVRETLPGSPDDLRITWQPMRSFGGHVEVLVAAASHVVLGEFQRLLGNGNRNNGPAILLPATVALLPHFQNARAGGELLLHVCSSWMTSVVLEDSFVRFWRTRDLSRVAAGELLQEIVQEAARVHASARDRLQIDITRTYLCARPQISEEFGKDFARGIGKEVASLRPDARIGRPLSAGEQRLFQDYAATVAGLVVNAS